MMAIAKALSVREEVVKERLGLTSNYAAAYAVKSVDVDVIAAYPITPQTTIIEKLAEFVANGEIDAEYIPVESEHSALSLLLARQQLAPGCLLRRRLKALNSCMRYST